MGATNFENEYRGPLGMGEAYQAEVAQALYERGHDPYNGTISTTSGVGQDPAVTAPMTAQEAREHLKDWWDRDEQPQKWEAAWAIPLKPDPNPDPMLADPWHRHSDEPGWLFYGWAAC